MSFILGGKGSSTASSLNTSATTKKYSTYISKGAKINGSLELKTPDNLKNQSTAQVVFLECEVEGEVLAEGELVIGESAVLKANIKGEIVTVFGTVEGDITVSKKLLLKAPAKIKGNIQTPLLAVEEGVIFEGSCSMPRQDQKSTAFTQTSSKPIKRTAELVK